MAQFHLPMALARLHPSLSGSDMQFLRAQKDEGVKDIAAFRALLDSKGIVIPPEMEVLLP